MNNDLFGGRYSADEVQRILDINARPTVLRKPETAWYKKSATEIEPSNKEKREFVHWLINDSNISLQSKEFLKDADSWIMKYQLRGFKYGLVTSGLTFAFMPVVRQQPFVRRFAFSMLPMAWFMRWGYVWGHENWWRRAKEIVVTYEIFVGTRSKFTMK